MGIPEERRRDGRGRESLCDEIIAENFQVWRKNWTSNSMKLIEHLAVPMKKDLFNTL